MIKLFNLFFTIFFLTCFFAKAGTLEDIKERGYLKCGISEDFNGFAYLNDLGQWNGFDIELCKTVSAAIFGVSNKVEYITTTNRSRFPLLSFKEIDLLIRNTTWSFSRDTNLEFDFVGINFYDGQAFMVSKSLDINSALELDGSRICLVSGSSHESNIEYFFEINSMKHNSIKLETFDECQDNYINGNCDVFTGDLSVLAVSRSSLPNPKGHSILPEIISKEPLGPVVRHGDNHWGDVVRWSLNVLIIAEEKNLNSNNIDNKIISNDREILRLLGEIGNYGNMLELDDKWAYNIIKQIGNYSTIYEKHLGINSALMLERGLNNLWVNGGLLYAPPFR